MWPPVSMCVYAVVDFSNILLHLSGAEIDEWQAQSESTLITLEIGFHFDTNLHLFSVRFFFRSSVDWI